MSIIVFNVGKLGNSHLRLSPVPRKVIPMCYSEYGGKKRIFPYVPAYAFWTIAKTTPVQVRLAPVHCLYNMLSSILDIVSSLGELPDVQYSCPVYF